MDAAGTASPGRADATALDGVRARLVEAAIRLLESDGPPAIQARRLTREIGASTTAVYHYFGGMPELLRAVVDEGFRQLERRLASVPVTSDAVEDICRLALAYLDQAYRNPHLYDLMFGLSAPGGQRPAGDDPSSGFSATQAGVAAFAHLVDAARRAIRSGRITQADPEHSAAQLWSILHGFISLDLAGHFSHMANSLEQVLIPLGTNLLVGLGDTRQRTTRSVAASLQPQS